MNAPSDLPAVTLVDGGFYWIKRRYEDPDTWTIAQWEAGCWWSVQSKEVAPRIICGPIPRPTDSDPPPSVQAEHSAGASEP